MTREGVEVLAGCRAWGDCEWVGLPVEVVSRVAGCLGWRWMRWQSRQMVRVGAGMEEAGRGTGVWHSTRCIDEEAWRDPENKETVINSRQKNIRH